MFETLFGPFWYVGLTSEFYNEFFLFLFRQILNENLDYVVHSYFNFIELLILISALFFTTVI